MSREGAFLANNVLFAAFAFVVLLGTVFPLIGEALDGRKRTVGAPFFDRLSVPLGLCLLTLMAIAPVLPWRKASGELLRERLFWPAVASVASLGLSVALGGRGWAATIAYGLGGFAAGAALRQLALATRRQGWRGLVGRANGGMIVHLGIIIIAVALASARSHQRTLELRLAPGETADAFGHEIRYLGTVTEETKQRFALIARVEIDGKEYRPRQSVLNASGSPIITPSVNTTLLRDVYLTLENRPADGEPALIKVLIQPLVVWLWIGGGLTFGGTFLAAFPGQRRRLPTAPTSEAPPVDDDPLPPLGDATLAEPAEATS